MPPFLPPTPKVTEQPHTHPQAAPPRQSRLLLSLARFLRFSGSLGINLSRLSLLPLLLGSWNKAPAPPEWPPSAATHGFWPTPGRHGLAGQGHRAVLSTCAAPSRPEAAPRPLSASDHCFQARLCRPTGLSEMSDLSPRGTGAGESTPGFITPQWDTPLCVAASSKPSVLTAGSPPCQQTTCTPIHASGSASGSQGKAPGHEHTCM